VIVRRVVVLALIAAAPSCGGGDRTARAARVRAEQARRLTADAGLSPGIQDILARAAGAVGATYTATYRLADGDMAVLSQAPPRRRIDVIAGAVTRTRLETGSATYSCLLADRRWSCQRDAGGVAAVGAFTPADVERTVDGLVASKSAYTFTTERRRVAGTTARCLITKLIPGGPPDPTRAPLGTLCVAASGAPLVVTGGQGNLQATGYSTVVRAAVFKLPARTG